jgi:hypothetical protein
MDIITVDLETFWSKTHSLSKMSPIDYAMHPETEIISCSVKVGAYNTDVFFGEDDIRHAFKSIEGRVSKGLMIAHNMSAFDALIFAWRFKLKPRMWGCTLAMARPIHAKTVGLSLGKLVAHYGLGVKDNRALRATQGKHLADFTDAERQDMKTYNRDDTDQCYALFNKLRPYYNAKELWHLDTTIRMFVEPKFMLDPALLDIALVEEQKRKRYAMLKLGKHLRSGDSASAAVMLAKTLPELEEAIRIEVASAPKFSAILNSLGVETPMKPSPSVAGKMVPALAKTDEGFIELQEHPNDVVVAATMARLAVKSTLLETRIGAFQRAGAAVGGLLPIPTHYCGADTTGRRSGFLYNPLNLPRVGKPPKISDALRNSMMAPPGYKVVVSDLSGIEMRVNHFLWRVPYSTAMWKKDPTADLYRASGAVTYECTAEEVTKDQRQIEKIKALGLGFGAGAATFLRIAKTMGGLDISLEQSDLWVKEWRHMHADITAGWKTCHRALNFVLTGERFDIDPAGMCYTEHGAIVLPSERRIRYPLLRNEKKDGKTEWFYGEGRHKARIYAGKIDENVVQSVARDVVCDISIQVYRETGFRPVMEVYDELVYIVPESVAQDHLDVVSRVMRTPPKWWPDLVTWSEGDIADTYGAAK